MTVKVVRKWFTEESTIGEMFIDGVFLCYTLEDKDRNLKHTDSLLWIKTRKVYGKTAIPTGTYKCGFTISNRFKRVLPEIFNVKGYTGVRIHAGNTAEDTHGCLLLGNKKAYDKIFESRLAMQEFFLKVAPSKEFTLIITKE
jgi:hypothetical protein